MSLLNFNKWNTITESIAFDPKANYPNKTFGYLPGAVDTLKVLQGGPGDDWGGSMQRALWFARTADDWAATNGKTGSLISSQKRSRVQTASGNTSDHFKGNDNAYAVDISAAGTEGDALLAYIMGKFGHPEYKGGQWFNITIDGYRYQVGWRVKNHYDHIHVGVKKTGGAPTPSKNVPSGTESLGSKLMKNPEVSAWLLKNVPNPVTAQNLDSLFQSDLKSFAWFKETFKLNDLGDPLTASPTSIDKAAPISGSVEDRWMDVTKKIIDKFEGGYWNNDKTQPADKICANHPYSDMFKNSGETMFGLDRRAGAIETIKPEGVEFFKIIDDDKKKLGMAEFCKKWTWNYRGGDKEEVLKNLAAKIMFKQYTNNMANFVKDPETKRRIENNKGLLLHMSYACWNGPGFFKGFAQKLQDGVKSGMSDRELIKVAKDSRTARLGGAWAKGTIAVNAEVDKESGLA